MPYVYRHIRLDKNEPFYIGIGSDKKYKRAFEKTRRNKMWYDVINKTDYEVDILIDGLSWEQACEKEKEFIKLYGRKDINNGSLVNMTDGGDGTNGMIMSEEWRKNKSNSLKGNKYAKNLKHSNEFIEKFTNSLKGNKYALGLKHSEKTKLKISNANKGRIVSDEYKKKLSERMKGNTYNKGKKLSEETKLKMSEAKKRYWENRKNK